MFVDDFLAFYYRNLQKYNTMLEDFEADNRLNCNVKYMALHQTTTVNITNRNTANKINLPKSL